MLQTRFVSGRYTLYLLLGTALLLWGVGAIFFPSSDDLVALIWPAAVSYQVVRVVSFLVYVATAFIINSFVIIKGRTPWLGGLFMLLTGLFPAVQASLLSAISVLMFVTGLVTLFALYQRNGLPRLVFSAFALLSVCSLAIPQFLYMLPLYYVYMGMQSVLGIRGFLASLLGIITPYWFLFAVTYLLPIQGIAIQDFLYNVARLFEYLPIELSLFNVALFAVELLVMVPCALVLARSSTPAKPLMRRMLAFFIVMNFFLCIVSFFRYSDFWLLFAWRMPGLAMMMAYIYTVRITKLSNICFVVLNIFWISVAVLGLWSL